MPLTVQMQLPVPFQSQDPGECKDVYMLHVMVHFNWNLSWRLAMLSRVSCLLSLSAIVLVLGLEQPRATSQRNSPKTAPVVSPFRG